MNSLWDRIRQRKLAQWALAYLAGGWLVLQVLDVLGQNLGLPSWVFRVTIALLAVGFLAALVLAWYHGEKGQQRVSGMEVLMLAGILVIAGAALGLVLGEGGPAGARSMASDAQGPAAGAEGDNRGEVASEIRSLAVLPLDNLSGDPEQEYFTDGMTEALTAELGQIRALTVISRTSAMQYRDAEMRLSEIARELQVDGLIEGSVLRAGDEVRITVQLVHGPTDRHLWSSSYQRDLRDIFALQGDVARRIAREVRITVAPDEETRLTGQEPVNPDAYQSYLKGRYHFNRWSEAAFRTAIRHYEEAVALDPDFALAHAALAEACVQPSIVNVHLPLKECKETALRAVELDDQLAEAHAALGRVLTLEWDWRGSEAAFQRALELNPSSVMAHQWYSSLLTTTLRLEKALEEIKRAEELDPLNLQVKTWVGIQMMRQRDRYSQAMAQWDAVLEMDPDYGLAIFNQGLVYADKGMVEEALSSARRAASRLGENAVRIRVLTAYIHAVDEEHEKALEILGEVEREIEDRASAFIGAIAMVYLELGMEDEALSWLEKGYEMRSVFLPEITSEHWFDRIRDHTRFRKLEQKMGLR